MAAILYSRICQIVFRFVFKGIGMTFHYAKKLSCNTKMHDLDVRLPTNSPTEDLAGYTFKCLSINLF